MPAVGETVNTDADVDAVNNVIETWIRFANANDGDGLIGLTCPDLAVIAPAGHPVSGAEAQELFRGFTENFTIALSRETTTRP